MLFLSRNFVANCLQAKLATPPVRSLPRNLAGFYSTPQIFDPALNSWPTKTQAFVSLDSGIKDGRGWIDTDRIRHCVHTLLEEVEI